MKGLVAISLLPLLASASPMIGVDTIHNEAAPILSSSTSKEIPNSYMIVFKDHVSHSNAAVHHEWVQSLHLENEHSKTELRKRSQLPVSTDIFAGLKHTYNIAGKFLGYAGHFDEDVIERVRRHPDVAFVEKDSEVHTMEEYETEKNAPWGLARVSHRDSLSFSTFNKYLYAADGGEGVDVYVIDTGTNVEHVDFEGRAEWGKTIPANDEDADGNGHGTHCSGTIAGKKYGVAKKAHIKAVKVLKSNGSGTMSDVVKGVEWAALSHENSVRAAKKGKGKKGFKGSAANMSLGGGKSVTLDISVNAAVDAGIHFAVAAGNDNTDSCKYSPAAAEKAVTVGASTLADERAYFSNYGKCNDIFAPGLNIQSTWIGSKYAVNTISGTSMASPHVAGLLAYLLSLQPSKDSAYAVADVTPKQLKQNLIAIATEGVLSDVPSNTANILAWNGGGSSNYTEIVHKSTTNKKMVEEIEEFVEDEMKEIKSYFDDLKKSVQ
ncbi:MAG: autophagic serine protease Alp2 [Lasallia pustulata]|uniref:Autophagic Serine protease alp2 n=1 Tax=Lasallia pustulata TaxID=136370 RepID=A0A1W5CVG3_9LECA|nr:MAG: autophagic serine protease Alp2 [Lasallia pustulata]SLM34816.1 autophagic serine protease alp2 [Lasallia pustulata]